MSEAMSMVKFSSQVFSSVARSSYSKKINKNEKTKILRQVPRFASDWLRPCLSTYMRTIRTLQLAIEVSIKYISLFPMISVATSTLAVGVSF